MPSSKASVLIVDDELSIRKSLSLVLTEIGYSVRTAEDGFSALAEVLEEIPEILLTDLNMPGMSGYELLSAVRRKYPAIRAVAMSGAFSGDEVPAGVAADAFYQKGSSLGSLLMILDMLPQMERRPVKASQASEPVRIQGHGNNSHGMTPLTIACPQCHKTSPLAHDGFGSMMREVHCAFCSNSIQYIVVEPSYQTMPQAFQRKARESNLAQDA